METVPRTPSQKGGSMLRREVSRGQGVQVIRDEGSAAPLTVSLVPRTPNRMPLRGGKQQRERASVRIAFLARSAVRPRLELPSFQGTGCALGSGTERHAPYRGLRIVLFFRSPFSPSRELGRKFPKLGEIRPVPDPQWAGKSPRIQVPSPQAPQKIGSHRSPPAGPPGLRTRG